MNFYKGTKACNNKFYCKYSDGTIWRRSKIYHTHKLSSLIIPKVIKFELERWRERTLIMKLKLVFLLVSSLFLLNSTQASFFDPGEDYDPRADLTTLKKGSDKNLAKILKTIKRKTHNINLCEHKANVAKVAKTSEESTSLNHHPKHKDRRLRNFRCFDHRGRKYKSPYKIVEIENENPNLLVVELDSKNIMGGKIDKYIPIEVEYKIAPPPLKY